MKSITRSVLTSSAVVIIALAAAQMWTSQAAPAPQSRQVPKFEVDPSWPKLPSKWVFGQVSSISIDEQGHAWVLQRPSTVRTDQKDKAAPPVLKAGADRVKALIGRKPSTAFMSTRRASSGSAATA